ncbi:MAG: alkaline phosphatase family protein [Bacteroidia bacterium]|nr:alkaline phosphatase family protein [Bacteroidia bacterium]
MKKILIVFLIITQYAFSQNKNNTPKLVIGIVVDQMRYDYLIKFQNNFTKGGFLKLMNEGIFLKNVHYNYIPTYTAPGHASIYTGTTPRYHQIIANDWYDKKKKKNIYCVKDETVYPIGTNNDYGKMSPIHLLSSTITDELKLLNKSKSKVISISLKDRSAILPGGHLADAAYWWDEQTGNFISSSFYMQQLPEWINTFNNQKLPEQYLQKNWTLLLKKEKYLSTLPDSNQYEKPLSNDSLPKFPYDFSKFLKNKKLNVLKYTPYGNSILIDLAKECIINEKLGKSASTDFLCISFSSTDYIGHLYGTEALETEDTYYRLDRDFNNFISFLDKNIGKDNYLIFLTADHAAAINTQYLKDNNFNVHYFNEEKFKHNLKLYLFQKYNDSSIVSEVINEQIYLNHDIIQLLKINELELKREIEKFCLQQPEIAEVFLKEDLKKSNIKEYSLYELVANGFSPSKSGDIALVLHPEYMNYSEKGTTHGSAYNYDTHVPLIFYGFKNKSLQSTRFYRITQIAPTLSFLLNINIPNACFDEPIEEVLNNINIPTPLYQDTHNQ